MANPQMNPDFPVEHRPQVRDNPFKLSPELLKSVVDDKRDLCEFGGIQGILSCLYTSLENGPSDYVWPTVSKRREVYGSNGYNEKPGRSFWMFVCEGLRAKTAIVLRDCAMVFIFLKVAIAVYWTLVVIVLWVITIAAIILCKHYSSTEEKKKKIFVKVTRDGGVKLISKGELVVGDIVQVYMGEQVPADGLFIDGRELRICEPCLKGEGALIDICTKRPHIPRGSTVQSGFAKMVVTSVGVAEREKMKLPG